MLLLFSEFSLTRVLCCINHLVEVLVRPENRPYNPYYGHLLCSGGSKPSFDVQNARSPIVWPDDRLIPRSCDLCGSASHVIKTVQRVLVLRSRWILCSCLPEIWELVRARRDGWDVMHALSQHVDTTYSDLRYRTCSLTPSLFSTLIGRYQSSGTPGLELGPACIALPLFFLSKELYCLQANVRMNPDSLLDFPFQGFMTTMFGASVSASFTFCLWCNKAPHVHILIALPWQPRVQAGFTLFWSPFGC